MDTMRGALERAKMLVGMEVDEESALPPPEEQSFFDDINRHCTLNTTQASTHARMDPSAYPLPLSPLLDPGARLYGFAICLAAGLTCTFLSMLVFFNPVKFGVTFTLGNLMALGRSVLFHQLSKFCLYIFAPFVHSKLLTLLAIILEFGALVWYSLSYIPFARSIVSKVMTSCFDTDF
ncbi:hypothetical protein BAE44_0010659 [Dichanthelium oligosanthes]|uniref:Vesicle transport protein n=1 Tax=Dichanthelium oligosanthes TaxID=888268 RepID=A0A1E5VT79_9POAL|nr:hypothetical protein BAE44_0010659 [Dichanthelium oligosanthes]